MVLFNYANTDHTSIVQSSVIEQCIVVDHLLPSGPGFSVSPTRSGLALGSSLCLWCLCGAFTSSR